jgi:4-alpha-glucanotransferase
VPIIAENLGVITPDVENMRHAYGYPGMYILQFAFASDANDPSLPHNIERNSAVYTGTHDNDTSVGWYEKASREEQTFVRRYVGTQCNDVSWDLLRAALASVAVLAIVPLQDVLRLGSAARMNMPGQAAGNWAWRFTEGQITRLHIAGLRGLADTYGRLEASTSSQSQAHSLSDQHA